MTAVTTSMPTVLITGGAGYIGANTALAFITAGFKLVVVDDLSNGDATVLPRGVPLYRLDAGDPALTALLQAHKIEAVVHFAARVRVDESVNDPLGYYASNSGVTRRLLEACVAANVGAFVLSSTAAVYGVPGRSPVVETDPTVPVSPYGRSKLAAEWAVEDAARAHGLRYANLRYFNVAGADPEGRAGPRDGGTHLLKIACEAAAGKRPRVEIYGTDYPTPDGTAVRDFIHVTDLAAAHVAAVRHLLDGGKNLTLNCGYGRGYSVRQALDTAARLEYPFEIVERPRRQGDVPAIVADVGLLRRTFDWRPAYDDLDAILRTGLAWERRVRFSSLPASIRGAGRPLVTTE